MLNYLDLRIKVWVSVARYASSEASFGASPSTFIYISNPRKLLGLALLRGYFVHTFKTSASMRRISLF